MEIDADYLAKSVTKAGRILLECGAEIYRVEDTMKRIALCYGADVVDPYATPTLLIISFSLNGHLTHNIKRVSSKTVNLNKIEEINNLSRELSHTMMDLDCLNEHLDKIDKQRDIHLINSILGATVCTFGFAFFFGGGINEAIFAVIIGTIVKTFVDLLSEYFPSSFFIHLFASSLLTALAIIFKNIIPYNQDIVIISSLMLLVPGLSITNAIRDSVRGDLLSGLSKATEAIFIAVALAVGSGLVMTMLGAF